MDRSIARIQAGSCYLPRSPCLLPSSAFRARAVAPLKPRRVWDARRRKGANENSKFENRNSILSTVAGVYSKRLSSRRRLRDLANKHREGRIARPLHVAARSVGGS